MDYLDELAVAIDRIITNEGITALDAQESFCDVEGFTPQESKILAGLDRLVGQGSLYFRNGRWFDPSITPAAG